MKLPVIGTTYKLHHSRKGNAVVRVTAVTPIDNGDAWVDVVLLGAIGTYRGIGAGSQRFAGDTDTVRLSRATFT